MRKFLISAALAASTFVAATPAAAQWYPQQPQGYGYGYNNYGQVRRLQVRIDQLQRQITQLDRRNILSDREAGRLRYESQALENRLRYAGRNGLQGQEAYAIERGIQRLEIRIQREASDGNRYGRAYYGQSSWAYNDNRERWGDRANWHDQDRDGRNDRWEDDQGQDHDD